MTTTATGPRDILTQSEAESRASRISDASYALALTLTGGSATYRGDVTISFSDSGSGGTFLCLKGKTIERFDVNGAAVEPAWDGCRLVLPGSALAHGANTVRVVYECEYDHNSGDGFHQFIDPEDGQEYLYTNFEPYEAHWLFPCFDQPDIKATYTLEVTAPAAWEVIHNSRELSAESAGDGLRIHRFETTKPFSTYLFCIVAGEYHAFREMHGDVAVGLYCRKSMVQYFDTAEVFEVTRQGLDFFATFFDFPYPFGKYDQIFVPEFNAGAMENVGAVTHNEFMIHRDPPTDTQRRRRAEVILHEMAHMWFGDLVTMKWWNDLWLNESFAEYMAFLSLVEATRFKTGWEDFNATDKNWAYRQDQLVTTHPIAGEVADTEQTFLNFDGITYGKGASTLKQLVATIGMDGFREGMRHYFRTHAYGNTTLAEFMAALETGSKRDLKSWADLWLRTPSLNTIGVEWQADGDRVSALSLTQSAPADYPTIRPHTVEVGLVRDEGGKITVTALAAAIDGVRVDVPAAVGQARPDLVFPNYNDHGYFKVALDAESVAFARQNIERIDDPLLRSLLWNALWSMVRDQQLKSTEFLALVCERAAREPRIDLIEVILGQAQTALARFVPESMKEAEGRKLFAAARTAIEATPPGDAKITWMRAMINAASHRDDLVALARLADGEDSVAGLTVDQQMRWSIAIKQAAYEVPGAADRLKAEAGRDPSDRGKREQLRGEVSFPIAETKATAWEKFNGEGYGSLHYTEAAMGGFNWPRQRDLLVPYVEKYFENIAGVVRTRDKEFYSSYHGALFPAYRVERATLDRSERLLAEIGDELPTLARMLRESNDELGRAIKCRAYAGA